MESQESYRNSNPEENYYKTQTMKYNPTLERINSLELNKRTTGGNELIPSDKRATINFDGTNVNNLLKDDKNKLFLDNLLLTNTQKKKTNDDLNKLGNLDLFSTNNSGLPAKKKNNNAKLSTKKYQKLSINKYSHLFEDVDEPLNSARKTTIDDNFTECSFSRNNVNINTTDVSIINDKVTSMHSYKNSILLKNKKDELARANNQKNKKSNSIMTDIFG